VNDVVIAAYVELSEQLAVEVLFSERIEQKLYDRLDQLWYVEMSDDDRAEAQHRLHAKGQAWEVARRVEEIDP
jgi:hypothetical protein